MMPHTESQPLHKSLGIRVQSQTIDSSQYWTTTPNACPGLPRVVVMFVMLVLGPAERREILGLRDLLLT